MEDYIMMLIPELLRATKKSISGFGFSSVGNSKPWRDVKC